MKKIIILCFLFIPFVFLGQNKQTKPVAKPQFKLAFVDESGSIQFETHGGTARLDTLLKYNTVILDNPNLSIVSFSFSVIAGSQNTLYLISSNSDKLPAETIYLKKKDNIKKIIIDNITVKSKDGKTTKFNTPLILKVIP